MKKAKESGSVITEELVNSTINTLEKLAQSEEEVEKNHAALLQELEEMYETMVAIIEFAK